MWGQSLLCKFAVAAVVMAATAQSAIAQGNYALALGATVGYDRPRGVPPDSWSLFGGFSVGVERRIGTAMSLRGSATLAAPSPKGDDISVCRRTPPGSPEPCLPDPSYASEYALGALGALVQPSRQIPLTLLVGGGWAAFQKAGGPPPLPRSRGFWQWGASTLLGHSDRAPRLEVTEIRFAGSVGRVRRLIGLELWVRY